MRKSSAKKISGNSKKKAGEAKIKAVPGASGETITKKERGKKVKPKTAEKTKARAEIKVGANAPGKKEKISSVPIVKDKDKEKEKIKKVTIKPASKRKRKSGQTRIKALPEKGGKVSLTTSKKGPAGEKRVVKAVTKAKAGIKKKTTGKSAKPARTVSALVGEKVSVGQVKEIEIKKPAEKNRKKPGVKLEVKQKTAEKYKKAVKKLARETLNKLNTKKFAEIPERKVKSVTRKKGEVRSAASVKSPTIPQEILPSEYGENSITLMPVDPYKLFVFWEMREDTLEMYEGEPTIRIYDVDGIDLNHTGNPWFDIGVNERIGARYIDVCPAGTFIAEIGIMYEGIFIAVASSRKVSTPCADVPLKSESPQKLYETGIRVGY